MRRTRFGWCSATHPRTKNVPEILRLASISSTRSVCGSTREGRDAQCSCPAAPCISVGWKYSSTSTLRTLRISYYILRTFAPVQHEDREVEQDGECQQNKRVHRLSH